VSKSRKKSENRQKVLKDPPYVREKIEQEQPDYTAADKEKLEIRFRYIPSFRHDLCAQIPNETILPRYTKLCSPR